MGAVHSSITDSFEAMLSRQGMPRAGAPLIAELSGVKELPIMGFFNRQRAYPAPVTVVCESPQIADRFYVVFPDGSLFAIKKGRTKSEIEASPAFCSLAARQWVLHPGETAFAFDQDNVILASVRDMPDRLQKQLEVTPLSDELAIEAIGEFIAKAREQLRP